VTPAAPRAAVRELRDCVGGEWPAPSSDRHVQGVDPARLDEAHVRVPRAARVDVCAQTKTVYPDCP
jgi:hypothetical protein